ncbi:MAG: hypothetical protein R6V86_00165 [Spirochaetia bacterium]
MPVSDVHLIENMHAMAFDSSRTDAKYLLHTYPPAQTSLMISFLENAFVNFGNVSVVDRQNLEKIMEEYQYQNSTLVSEETAVEPLF